VDIDELEIDGVSEGQKAEVPFDAFDGETYEGTVQKVSGVGTNTGGVTTYAVTITLDGDARMKDAMSATAKITVASKDQALLVPSEAILAEGADRFVQVFSNGQVEKVKVDTGLANEVSTEILSGISEGDTVVLQSGSRDELSDYMNYMQQNSPMGRTASGSSRDRLADRTAGGGTGSGS